LVLRPPPGAPQVFDHRLRQPPRVSHRLGCQPSISNRCNRIHNERPRSRGAPFTCHFCIWRRTPKTPFHISAHRFPPASSPASKASHNPSSFGVQMHGRQYQPNRSIRYLGTAIKDRTTRALLLPTARRHLTVRDASRFICNRLLCPPTQVKTFTPSGGDLATVDRRMGVVRAYAEAPRPRASDHRRRILQPGFRRGAPSPGGRQVPPARPPNRRARCRHRFPANREE
jgi:hypothetical protein